MPKALCLFCRTKKLIEAIFRKRKKNITALLLLGILFVCGAGVAYAFLVQANEPPIETAYGSNLKNVTDTFVAYISPLKTGVWQIENYNFIVMDKIPIEKCLPNWANSSCVGLAIYDASIWENHTIYIASGRITEDSFLMRCNHEVCHIKKHPDTREEVCYAYNDPTRYAVCDVLLSKIRGDI